MLSLNEKFLLNVLREQGLMSAFILNQEKLSIAYLQCLELVLIEPPDSWIENHIKEVARDAEELLIEYIYNFKKESFLAPYREIVKRFYGYTEEEIQAVYKAQCDLHGWEI